jgi:hypothetical protein
VGNGVKSKQTTVAVVGIEAGHLKQNMWQIRIVKKITANSLFDHKCCQVFTSKHTWTISLVLQSGLGIPLYSFYEHFHIVQPHSIFTIFSWTCFLYTGGAKTMTNYNLLLPF